MTIDDKIDRLRRELSDYHVEVREHIAHFLACEATVRKHEADLYGTPGDKQNNGLAGEVAVLKRSRRLILIALRGAWAVLLLAGGAFLATIL